MQQQQQEQQQNAARGVCCSRGGQHQVAVEHFAVPMCSNIQLAFPVWREWLYLIAHTRVCFRDALHFECENLEPGALSLRSSLRTARWLCTPATVTRAKALSLFGRSIWRNPALQCEAHGHLAMG